MPLCNRDLQAIPHTLTSRFLTHLLSLHEQHHSNYCGKKVSMILKAMLLLPYSLVTLTAYTTADPGNWTSYDVASLEPGRVRPEWVEDFEAKFGKDSLGNRWTTIKLPPWSPMLTDPVYQNTRSNTGYDDGPMTDYTPYVGVTDTDREHLIATMGKKYPGIHTVKPPLNHLPPWHPVNVYLDVADPDDPYEQLYGPKPPFGQGPGPQDPGYDLEALDPIDVAWDKHPLTAITTGEGVASTPDPDQKPHRRDQHEVEKTTSTKTTTSSIDWTTPIPTDLDPLEYESYWESQWTATKRMQVSKEREAERAEKSSRKSAVEKAKSIEECHESASRAAAKAEDSVSKAVEAIEKADAAREEADRVAAEMNKVLEGLVYVTTTANDATSVSLTTYTDVAILTMMSQEVLETAMPSSMTDSVNVP